MTQRLLYIMSPSYSGSTLLTRLLAAYPTVATMGELKAPDLGDLAVYQCSCGARLVDCEFWATVRAALEARGMSLDFSAWGTAFRSSHWLADRILRPNLRGPWLEALRHFALARVPSAAASYSAVLDKNQAIIEIIQEIQGGEIFLDDSKDPSRAMYFNKSGRFDLKVISLVRDGRGTINSDCRHNGITASEASLAWRSKVLEMQRLEQTLAPGQLMRMSYEQLCTDTAGTLAEIEQFAGIPHPAEVMDINAPQHILGNDMRMRQLDEITLDEKWRSQLDDEQLQTFYRLCGSMNQELGYSDD